MSGRWSVLGVENAGFAYNKGFVFRHISFLLDDAKTALVGENGAGKSTLLKCLTGELELDEGHVVRSRSRQGRLRAAGDSRRPAPSSPCAR